MATSEPQPTENSFWTTDATSPYELGLELLGDLQLAELPPEAELQQSTVPVDQFASS